MDKASEALFSLKPVTFRYKKEIDPAGTPQFGLVAEDVEKISPDLVVRDENGVVNTVRYESGKRDVAQRVSKRASEGAATKWHARKPSSQDSRTANDDRRVKKEMETVVVMLKEQESQIQGVSAQIEMSKPATSVVLNNP